MPEQSLLDVLRRSGGLAAIARQLDISPADAVAAARSLMPLVQFGFRRRVEQADNREAGLQALLALLDQAGGGILVSRVLHEDPLEPEAASALLTAIFGATSAIGTAAAEAGADSGIEPAVMTQVLPLLVMLAGGYLAARGTHMPKADQLAELGPLIGLDHGASPLDALV